MSLITLVKFTEFKSDNPVYINPDHVVTVFIAPEVVDPVLQTYPNDNAGKTVVVFLGGSVVVNEAIDDVISSIAEMVYVDPEETTEQFGDDLPKFLEIGE